MATGRPARGSAKRSKSERVARGTAAFAWRFRAELTAVPIAPAVVYGFAAGSGVPGLANTAGVLATVCGAHAVRKSEVFQSRRKARQVGGALVTATLARAPKRPGDPPRPPVMRRPVRTPAGWKVDVRVPDRTARVAFEHFMPIVEDRLCSAVTVEAIAPPPGLGERTVARAREITPGVSEMKPSKQVPRGWVRLKIRDRDPLAGVSPVWPHLSLVHDDPARGGVLDLWDGIFAGVDEDGEPVWLTIPQRNLLIGGVPGGGKSVFLQEICAAAALDPNVRLSLIDPSGGVELGRWAPVARNLAETADEAVELLREDNAAMQLALEELRDGGRRNVARGDIQSVMVVDEIAALTAHPDAKTRKMCGQMLADRVGRGRKVGYITVAAALKPTGDIVPTFLSMLMEYRLAFRCSKSIMSDTILGDGWAGQGFDASDPGIISSADLGVGLLMAGGQAPTRIKTAFQSDEALDRVLTYALAMRRRRAADPVIAGPPTRPSLVGVPHQPTRVAVSVAKPVVPEPTPTPTPPAPDNAARTAHNATKYTRHRTRPGSRARRLYDTTPKPATAETSKD